MEKLSKELSEATERLSLENKELQQQLLGAREMIAILKAGDIDAVVVGHKKDLKVYTEKTSDQTYRILIEKMHEGAITINKAGIILFCNSHFANMVQLPLQKVIGNHFQKFVDKGSTEQFNDLINKGWDTNAHSEVALTTDENQTIPVLMSVNTLTVDEHTVLSIIVTDLTTQNKYREELQLKTKQLELKNIELENANRDLTTFTYISSHDLQEPLRKIQTFVSIIFKDMETGISEANKMHFKRLHDAAKRMQTLIEDLLTYSRAKSDERKFENTDLNSLVADVVKDYEEQIAEKKATLETLNLGKVSVIPTQFRQVLQNLIGNSLKFAKEQQALNIVIKTEAISGNTLNNLTPIFPVPNLAYCHITYTDNGIGFDPQYNERIFEVFQRLHSREEYNGTGMGLAICKRIIENHQGIITGAGQLNVGSRFDIYIPVSHSLMVTPNHQSLSLSGTTTYS